MCPFKCFHPPSTRHQAVIGGFRCVVQDTPVFLYIDGTHSYGAFMPLDLPTFPNLWNSLPTDAQYKQLISFHAKYYPPHKDAFKYTS